MKLDTVFQDVVLKFIHEQRIAYTEDKSPEKLADFYLTLLSAVGLDYCVRFQDMDAPDKEMALALLTTFFIQITDTANNFLLYDEKVA